MPSYSSPVVGAPQGQAVQIPPGTPPYTMVMGHPIFKIGGGFFTQDGLPYSPGQFLGPLPPAPVGQNIPPNTQPNILPAGPMPSYDQRMDQAAMPVGPQGGPGGIPGAYGMAQQAPLAALAAQAPPQAGPMDASIMGRPPPAAADASSLPIPPQKPPAPDGSDSLPVPLEKPPQPDQMAIEGGFPDLPPTRGKRVRAAKAGQPSESDVLNKLSAGMGGSEHQLNAQQIAQLISQRLAANS